MSEIIRDVIIRTRVEHQRGQSRNAGGGSSGGPLGDRVTGKQAEKEITAEKKKQTSEEMNLLTARRVYERERNRSQSRQSKWQKNSQMMEKKRQESEAKNALRLEKIKRNSAKLEDNRQRKETKNALYLEKVKRNSLKMERDRTKEIIKQARIQDSFMSSSRAQRVKRQAERELAYRSATGQSANIGGRKQKGGSVTKGGSFLETGIAPLDFANKIGFQAFITTMTVRMIGHALGGMAGGLAGLSGEGEGIIAQATRAMSGDARSRNDPIRQWIGDTTGDVMRGFGGRAGGEAAAAIGLGFRGQRVIDQGQNISSRAKQIAAGRMTNAMKEEDRLLKEKRQILKEEMDVLRQRVQADKQQVDRAMGKREAAIQSFGRMSREDQIKSLGIAKQIKGGATPASMTKEDREFMLANTALFGGLIDTFAYNSATKGGVENILNMTQGAGELSSLNQQPGIAQAQLNRTGRDLADTGNMPAFSAQLNIERLELDSQEIVDSVNELLAPYWEKELEKLRIELQQFKQRIRDEFKTGGGVGNNKNFQVAPQMSFRP